MAHLADLVVRHFDSGLGLTPELADLARSLKPAISAPKIPEPRAMNGFAPWADYQIPRRYKTDEVGPTCVTSFADGAMVRMTTATLPGKPLNIGRGLRICLAAWESRQHPKRHLIEAWLQAGNLSGAEWLAKRNPPAITSCHFETSDGEIIATFDPADANAAIGESKNA